MKIDDTHLVYVGGISEDPTIKIYRTVAYEKYKRGTGACAKNLYFQNGVLLSDERVKQIEDSIKAKRELKQSYDLQVSRSAKEMNLTQVYDRDNFYIFKNAKGETIYFSNGKQTNKSDVASEIQQYNNKVKADKEAELAKIAKDKQDKIDAEKRAVEAVAMMKAQAIQNEKNRIANQSINWTVSAGAPSGSNYPNCNPTEVRQGTRNQDGSVTFQVSYSCRSRTGTSGSSGSGTITCGVGLSNSVSSTGFTAVCRQR